MHSCVRLNGRSREINRRASELPQQSDIARKTYLAALDGDESRRAVRRSRLVVVEAAWVIAVRQIRNLDEKLQRRRAECEIAARSEIELPHVTHAYGVARPSDHDGI